MKLPDKILTLRKAMGMSQEELAEKLNVSRQTISRWEIGSSQPEAANVFRISLLFGVSADFLLNDELDNPPADNKVTTSKRRYEKIIALCISCFGLLGNFIIYILSRFIEVMVPVITYEKGERLFTWKSGITGYSYKYFIQEHNLEFLTALFWILTISGFMIIFRERLSPLFRKIKDSFSSFYNKLRKH